jgi:hypothetical protein
MAKFLIEVDTTKSAASGSVKVNGIEIKNAMQANVLFYRDKEGNIGGAEVQVVASEIASENIFVETHYYSSASELESGKKIGEEIQPGVFKSNQLDLAKMGIQEIFTT